MSQESPVTSSKTSIFCCNDLGILVKTKNQSIGDQPCLWLVHGSGGISTNEDIWIDRAFQEGYTVIIVDSYSNRGIFKQMWETLDEYRISPKDRALDIVNAYNFLNSKKGIIPFANLKNSIAVGFSDGGTACLWLQQIDFPDIWKNTYSLYPGLKPTGVPNELYKIRNNNAHVFVGELDNWTPAFYDVDYQKISGCKLTIWPDTHHSFSKPGMDHYHPNILNHKRERGVYCKYNEDATNKTMDIIFNE